MRTITYSVLRFLQVIAGLIVIGYAAKDATDKPKVNGWPELIILGFATYTTSIALMMGIVGAWRKCGSLVPFFDFTVAILAITNGIVVLQAIPIIDKARCKSSHACPLKLIEYGLFAMALLWMATAALGFLWGQAGLGKLKRAIGHTSFAGEKV